MTRGWILALGLGVTFGSGAFAQTVRTWVSASGNDANACSRNAPCRNFGAAMDAVDSGGEVVAIDSAGYGPVTITKAVSIIAPPGIHAAIAPSAGNAITIIEGLTAPVLLRGLFLNSQGAASGVWHDGENDLFIEDCEINGFSAFGIQVNGLVNSEPVNPYVSVKSCTVRNGGYGIIVGGGAKGTIDGTLVENNVNAGIYTTGNVTLTVRKTISSNNSHGFWHMGYSMDVTDSAVFKCGAGFFAFGSGVLMQLDRCLVSENTTGLAAGAFGGPSGGRMFVSNSMITNNATGIAVSSGSIQSRGDNTLEGNPLGNTFTAGYTAK